jgi:hypothetical protein
MAAVPGRPSMDPTPHYKQIKNNNKEPSWKQVEGQESIAMLFLPPGFTLVSFPNYSSTLKMEVTYSPETSVDFQRTTRSYIPEDRTLRT